MFKPYKFRADGGRLQKDFRYRIVDGGAPVFSWAVLGGVDGACQSAYRVRVSHGETALWDSGWVKSRDQRAAYAGAELPRGEKLKLEVALRDNLGNESDEGCDWFIRGDVGDWDAVWIGASEDVKRKPIYFRHDFTLDSDIAGGCLYICGLGYHKAYLNGTELDISVLDPAHSDYTKTCYYTVIPIDRALLRRGTNTLGVIVAEGWRRNDAGIILSAVGDRKIVFFGSQQLAARLELRLSDGGTERVETGSGWKWAHGAISESNIYDGETYDSAAEIAGWNLPGEVPAVFSDAVILPPPGGTLRPMTLEPIREGEIFAPVELYSPAPGVYIADFGQNLAGVVRLTLPKKLASGQKITIVHAEMLDEDGGLYTAPLRVAKATDTYIASGENDLAVWQPMFTYHGFRYARIEGLGLLDPADIRAVSLHTDLDNGSSFSCGSALANQIHKNIVMTERANMHSILTDCPQRDERMQWLNDATVRFEETPFNFDIGRMFPKIIDDIIDAQHDDGAFTCCSPFVFGGLPADPVCSSFLVAGKQALDFMGDADIVRAAYSRFEAWEKLLLSRSTEYIVDYSYYGDWAGPGYACVGGEEGANSAVTPGQLMSTGYSYYNAVLLAGFARKLGMADAFRHWTEIAEMVRGAYLAKWYDPATGVVATGSQGAQAFSLWLDILPEEGREKAALVMRDNLVENAYKITTGNLCSRYLLDMLARFGYSDDAWKLVTREEYPSFGYMIQNEATTIWERFELKKSPGMNSHSHPMYGAAGYWFYAWLCGIKNIRGGFAQFEVNPVYPAGLLHAHAVVDTPRGELSVKWTRRYGKLHLYVNVPFGCEAKVKVDGKFVTAAGGFHAFEWEESV